jgi:hypothetical protein
MNTYLLFCLALVGSELVSAAENKETKAGKGPAEAAELKIA